MYTDTIFVQEVKRKQQISSGAHNCEDRDHGNAKTAANTLYSGITMVLGGIYYVRTVDKLKNL